jgi:hypothetical protein
VKNIAELTRVGQRTLADDSIVNKIACPTISARLIETRVKICLLLAIDAKPVVLTLAFESIDLICAGRVVEARLRQAVTSIHRVIVVAYAHPAQSPFPATCAFAGKIIESVNTCCIVLARNKFAFVDVSFTQFA